MQNLQQALKQSTGKITPAEEPVPIHRPPPSPVSIRPAKQPSRAGQVNISAWLHRDFKSSLRLVQARKGPNATLQNLMTEALNNLFTKYDVPTIRS
jgi:hypothetical protein